MISGTTATRVPATALDVRTLATTAGLATETSWGPDDTTVMVYAPDAQSAVRVVAEVDALTADLVKLDADDDWTVTRSLSLAGVTDALAELSGRVAA